MKPQLTPVRVRREEVVRTIVGLRPFRPSGFRVGRDVLGDKILVHDYGHGGGGVTLSWGTAALAAELLSDACGTVAVLGGGAVGLAAARTLQARGHEVTIYTQAMSPDTTSDIAGARFYPSDVFDPKVVTPAFMRTLWRAVEISYAAFSALDPREYGVFYYPTYCCRETPIPAESPLHFKSPMQAFLPGLRDLPDDDKPFDYPIVRAFQSMLVEPAIYLPALRRAFEGAGGRIVSRTFSSLEELRALSEPILVNCFGLGARTLFGDDEIYPIRGQLTILPPQPTVDYIALPPDLYMFPRRDGIVLGGTYEHRVWSMAPDLAARDRIVAAHERFFAALTSR
jgi:glycine/D-amino acid oxidase-like deaminating enzyme